VARHPHHQVVLVELSPPPKCKRDANFEETLTPNLRRNLHETRAPTTLVSTLTTLKVSTSGLKGFEYIPSHSFLLSNSPFSTILQHPRFQSSLDAAIRLLSAPKRYQWYSKSSSSRFWTNHDDPPPPSSPSASTNFKFDEPPFPEISIVSRRQSLGWIVTKIDRHVPLSVLYDIHHQQRPSSAAKQPVRATKVRVRRAAAAGDFNRLSTPKFELDRRTNQQACTSKGPLHHSLPTATVISRQAARQRDESSSSSSRRLQQL